MFSEVVSIASLYFHDISIKFVNELCRVIQWTELRFRQDN